MSFTQLNPPIPVHVIAKSTSRTWPEGPGYAIAMIDYSQEHSTLWKVAMQAGGEVWDVPQSYVRLQHNISMERVS